MTTLEQAFSPSARNGWIRPTEEYVLNKWLTSPEAEQRLADALWERGLAAVERAGQHRTPTLYMRHPDAATLHARAIFAALREQPATEAGE